MKNSHKSLEKFRGIFFQIGLIIATSLTLLAFEWTTSVNVCFLPTPDRVIEGDFDFPLITYPSIPKKPEIKLKTPKVNFGKINIVITDPNNQNPNPEPDPNPNPTFDPNKWTKPENPDPETTPTAAPEVMPEFIGGVSKLFEYLGENLKYPELAKIAGISGKVFVQFIVDKNGKIKDVKIIQGINTLLNNEALRVVENMPDWKPGKQHGKHVSVIYNLPISFKLK